MPVTRRSTAAQRPSSLLGHFQATKRSSSSIQTGAKGKGKAVVQPIGVSRVQEVTEDSPDRFATPEPRTGDVVASTSASAMAASSVAAPTVSPPPEMIEAEHKSPVSVRSDPDKNKLFLLISPGAQARARRNQEGLSIAAPPPYLRQGSPSTDRTPTRETPPGPLEPPQAPRKRRLSQLSYERFQAQSEESPLPHDKKRPSFRALGASQEGGLSLMDLDAGTESEDASRAQTPTRATQPRAGDDDLVITPKSVREQPTGHPLTSFATPTKAAKFVDPFDTPRPKPTISAGIFSSLASSPKAGPSKHSYRPAPAVPIVAEEENPFIDQSPEAPPALDAAQGEEIAPLPYSVSADLPLPAHYNSLYLLHTAIERALVVHLATAGLGSSSSSAASSDAAGASSSSTSCIRLPNIISYSALQPLVERAAGRKLGPIELARLTYIWSNGRIASIPLPQRNAAPTAPPEQLPKDGLGGLGFIITRQRSLDSSGRRRWDWSLGIELTISRTRRQVTPPMQVSYGTGQSALQMPSTPPSKSTAGGVFGIDTPPSTPPSAKRKRETSSGSGGSASPSVGREGMSFVAMWNNGIEERKAEVGKRLRTMCAQTMEEWLNEREGLRGSEELMAAPVRSERAQTPETQVGPRSVEVGHGGLLTPSATRPEGRKAGRRTVHFSEEELDGKPDVKSAGQAPEWQRPPACGELTAWHPDFILKDAPPIPCALLPSLREASSETRITKQPRQAATAASAASSAESTPSTVSLSLVERIKAKEEAKRAASLAQRHFASLPGDGAMSSFKRRSTLSRLNDVASNLYLLFTASSSSSSSPTTLRSASRFPVLPLPDVLSSISKSSKVALSTGEARVALDLLREVAPGFVELRIVGGKEWARLVGGDVGLAEVRMRVRDELERAK